MRHIARAALIAVIILSASLFAQASILDSGYYQCSEISISVPQYSFMGGFDVLPNGDYVINDGHAVREITQAGTEVGTIYSYSEPVAPSFVRYHDGNIYFADTSDSSSMVRSIPVTGGDATDLAQLAWNYDIDFSGDQPYVAAGNTISKINADGSTSDVAAVTGYSGPVAFDASGNLYYVPSKYPFTTAIYEWNAAKVRAAVGGSLLGPDDADAVVPIGGAAGLVFDKQGRLIFSNNSGGQARIQRWDGASITTLATFTLTDVTSPAVTFLRYDEATGDIYAGLNYYTGFYEANYNYIAKLAYVPEPSSLAVLGSLLGLVGSVGLLRGRRK